MKPTDPHGPFVTEERFARSLARAALATPRQLAMLRSWRLGAGDERALTCFFHTHSQAKADGLAQVLRAQGMAAVARPATTFLVAWEPTFLHKPSWVVTGTTPPLALTEDVLLPWAEAQCRLALPHDCEFNGWHCPTPDFLERNDDYCLQGRADGRMALTLYRWNAAAEAALADNDIYWVSPGSDMPSLKVLAPHAAKVRGLLSPAENLDLAESELLPFIEQIHLPRAHARHGDYRRLPRLQRFCCLDAEKLDVRTLDNPALRELELRRPRKLKSLAVMNAWQGLESLALHAAPLTTLDGLGPLQALRELRLAHCRSLADIGALALAPGIERLEIFHAPKARHFEPIAALPALRWIFAHDPKGALAGHDVLRHWPQVQSASLLLSTDRADLGALAGSASLAEAVLYTAPGYELPSEEALRAMLESQGRQVRSLLLRPKDACPSVQVTFESDYWRLPERPAGHARTVVN